MTVQTVVQRLRVQVEVGLFNVPAGHRYVTFSDAADAIEAANAAAEGLAKAAEDALLALEGVERILHAQGYMQGIFCPAVPPLRTALAAYRAGAA